MSWPHPRTEISGGLIHTAWMWNANNASPHPTALPWALGTVTGRGMALI